MSHRDHAARRIVDDSAVHGEEAGRQEGDIGLVVCHRGGEGHGDLTVHLGHSLCRCHRLGAIVADIGLGRVWLIRAVVQRIRDPVAIPVGDGVVDGDAHHLRIGELTVADRELDQVGVGPALGRVRGPGEQRARTGLGSESCSRRQIARGEDERERTVHVGRTQREADRRSFIHSHWPRHGQHRRVVHWGDCNRDGRRCARQGRRATRARCPTIIRGAPVGDDEREGIRSAEVGIRRVGAHLAGVGQRAFRRPAHHRIGQVGGGGLGVPSCKDDADRRVLRSRDRLCVGYRPGIRRPEDEDIIEHPRDVRERTRTDRAVGRLTPRLQRLEGENRWSGVVLRVGDGVDGLSVFLEIELFFHAIPIHR